MKLPHIHLLLRKLKKWIWVCVLTKIWLGILKKMQIPTSVDSCTPDPWPPLDSVPTFGEFVPRFGISTSFEENLGIWGILGSFREIAFFGINLGKIVVMHFPLMWKSGCDLLSVTGKSSAQLHHILYFLYLPGLTIIKECIKSWP